MRPLGSLSELRPLLLLLLVWRGTEGILRGRLASLAFVGGVLINTQLPLRVPEQSLQVEVPQSPAHQDHSPKHPQQCDVSGQRLRHCLPVKLELQQQLSYDDGRHNPGLRAKLAAHSACKPFNGINQPFLRTVYKVSFLG